MILENLSKEELIKILRDFTVKCVESVEFPPSAKFEKGHRYLVDMEYPNGVAITDDNGNTIRLLCNEALRWFGQSS